MAKKNVTDTYITKAITLIDELLKRKLIDNLIFFIEKLSIKIISQICK